MNPAILSGSANPALADAVAAKLGLRPVARTVERFPDGELHVEIEESVRGRHVYLVQPTSPPAEAHLFELLFLADACRRSGAERLTAVVPYLGYARQDRRARGREPVGARVVADLTHAGGFGRMVAIDLHTTALEGFFSMPLEHLSAVPLLAHALAVELPADAVVVSPDLGAVKLAERYARALDLPVAIVHKARLSGERVEVRRVTGEVRGRRPIVVDDMITTGGTVEAAARALLDAGCEPEITVVATHGLFVGAAADRLAALPLTRLLATDTVAPPAPMPRRLAVESVAQLLADAISRLTSGRSLRDLAAPG